MEFGKGFDEFEAKERVSFVGCSPAANRIRLIDGYNSKEN